MKNHLGIQQRHLIATYSNRGLTIVKGKGVYLYDQAGKKYLDLMSNIGVNVLGHSHPFLVSRLRSQLKKLTNLHASFANDIRSETLQKLLTFLPANLKRVYFSSTGTETIEAAIKFASLATGRFKFLAASNGYHGKTLGSLALTSSSDGKYQKPFKKILPSFGLVEYGNIDDLKKKLNPKIAAVVLEPIQGEGGIIVPPSGYLKGAEKLCRQNNTLLILDEIQSGTGRTGAFLACEKEGVGPDVVCLSKGLGGGMPIGATVVSEKIAAKIPRGAHTSTFGGNPLACCGCLATLEHFEKSNLLAHVQKIGKYFIDRLRKLKSPKIREVRGRGLMIGLQLKIKATPILKKLQDEGIIAAPSVDDTIRFLPPLIIKKKEIDLAISKLKRVLHD